MKQAITLLLVLVSASAFSQKHFSKNEISINGFRSPSIGLEYRYRSVSVHAGYYITSLEKDRTHKFFKAGVTVWFLPIGKKQNPSSFYAGASYLRGFNLAYQNKNAASVETGFRWMAWKGLNGRIGAIALAAPGQRVKLNPAGGISYSFFF